MPEAAEPQQPETTVVEEETASYDKGEEMNAADPPDRAWVKPRKVAATTPFSPGEEVWLKSRGINYAMVIEKSGYDKEKGQTQYALKHPDGRPYIDGAWVEQGLLNPRR